MPSCLCSGAAYIVNRLCNHKCLDIGPLNIMHALIKTSRFTPTPHSHEIWWRGAGMVRGQRCTGMVRLHVPSQLARVAELLAAKRTRELLDARVLHEMAPQVCAAREALAAEATLVAVATFVQVLVQLQPVAAHKVPTANRADMWADSATFPRPPHCCCPL